MLSTGKPDEPGIPERWFHAAEALGEIGPQARMAIPALIAALNQLLDSKKQMPDLDPMVDAIGRLAPGSSSVAAAADVLIRLLDPRYQSWYAGARSHAAKLLGSFGRTATAAIPNL